MKTKKSLFLILAISLLTLVGCGKQTSDKAVAGGKIVTPDAPNATDTVTYKAFGDEGMISLHVLTLRQSYRR